MSSRTLPSRPTPRSRPVGRAKDEDDYRQPARTPLPSAPRITSSQGSRTPTRPPPPRGRIGEAKTVSSSSSSSGTSFLDRMKMRGGETSSRTSLEDEYEEQPKRGGGWASAKSRRPVLAEEEQFDEEEGYYDSDAGNPPAGHGYDIWSRVTAVAGNLTVNVSKAWEKGIGTVDGEETPPGQESRLTKAMKAYHLDRARSPADLPAWLFDERERGTGARSWSAPKRDEYEDQFLPEPEPRQRGGLRDIYDKAAASSSSVPSSSRRAPEGGGTSGAANRLKAIREAKRTAMQTQPPSDTLTLDDSRQGPRHQEERSSSSTGVRGPPARVGLPSGPGRARRL